MAVLSAQYYRLLFLCRILGRQGRPTAPPGTGVCKPASGKLAARYRQMVAAVDETAQAIPTVSPFDPAVRDHAIALLRFGRCLRRSMALGSRSYLRCDRFDGTEIRSHPPSLHLCPAGSPCVQSHAAAKSYLHTDYEWELVPLFIKVQKNGTFRK